MRLQRVLSILILTDVALGLASVSGAEPGSSLGLDLIWFFVVGSTVAAWVGLLWRLSAARILYLVSWLAYLGLIALRAPAPVGGPAEAVQLLLALNGGAILALAWLSDLRGRFLTLTQALRPARAW